MKTYQNLKMHILVSIIVPLLVWGCISAIEIYNMEYYCRRNISMMETGVYQSEIILNVDSDTWQEHKCELRVQAWQTWNQLGFYFEHLDIPCGHGYLVFYDGEEIIPELKKVCSDSVYNSQYTTSGGQLTIKYVTKSHVRLYHAMSLIVTGFRYGKCKKYEYECDNGRCIDDSLACGPYKSCGYSVDCHPGVGILRDVCLVVMGGIMFSSIIMAMLCCCRRKQSQNKMPNLAVHEVYNSARTRNEKADLPPPYIITFPPPSYYGEKQSK